MHRQERTDERETRISDLLKEGAPRKMIMQQTEGKPKQKLPDVVRDSGTRVKIQADCAETIAEHLAVRMRSMDGAETEARCPNQNTPSQTELTFELFLKCVKKLKSGEVLGLMDAQRR
mmetsp:Transcript_34796/g.75863  ORF Transcript_34796/g.75863 Transcript_34796/m.75863 type:complete len:118 (-) Transcript_34796:504-857(-)